jgi:Na+-driven multidrug efflux pump
MRHLFGLPGCLTWAFATTTSTMVSNLIGQGRTEEVPLLIKRILTLSTGITFVVCICLNIWPEQFLMPFVQSESFIAESIPVMRVVTGAMMLMSFGTIFLNAVTGSGNTRITFLIEAGAIIGYCVYVYLTAEYYFLPIQYVWMSEWLYWFGMFLPAWWYMRSGRWKNKQI